MVQAITITNFKPFGDEAPEKLRFPIRPITLIYGENSSGKSSFLHALLYLCELLRGNYNVSGVQRWGKVVDLGGFRQFVHRQDETRRVGFTIELDTARVKSAHESLKPYGVISVVLQVGRRGGQGAPALLKVAVAVGEITVASFIGDTDRNRMRLESFHPDRLNDFEGIPEADKPTWPVAFNLDDVPEGQREGFVAFMKIVYRALVDWTDSFAYVGPLRAYPERGFIRNGGFETDAESSGQDCWDRLRDDSALRERVNKWLESLNVSGKCRFTLWERLRRDRLEIEEDRDKQTVLTYARENSIARDGDQPNLADLDAALTRYFDDKRRGSSAIEVEPELAIQDSDSGMRLSHRDVGVGYSQVLPVLVHAIGETDRVITIEQPELHLHPALQCDLGDLFIEGIRENGNTFILETHSEYILYRLMHRLREEYERTRRDAEQVSPGEAVDTSRSLKAHEDIAVLYLSRGTSGAEVENLQLAPDGDGFLGIGWPKGFFAERSLEFERP